MDANLNHCLATRKSLTGCLHFVNKTPVDWYSKKQATVETATYGSEFVAAQTATEQIMDCRILGLTAFNSLLQYVNRLGFEICSVNRMNNRTRKLGYVNLNWPRCSARVTESLALTDGGFCQKQTLYILDYVKPVSL